jgi:oxaloacetate decarboxylase alpha subunit
MNIKEIKEMINLMNENGLIELEIEKEGMKIRLKKTSSDQGSFNGPVLIERERLQQPQIQAQPSAPVVEKTPSKFVEIKAPMVGTFYRAPAPEAPPYVEAGQNIEPGQVICIIEAMKLMNEIKSEIKGKIIEVLAENAEPVEFGQPMFIIEPI